MGTIKSVPQIRSWGNLDRAETIVTVKFLVLLNLKANLLTFLIFGKNYNFSSKKTDISKFSREFSSKSKKC